MISPRELLIYFAHKYQGDWANTLNAIKRKEQFSTQEVRNLIDNLHYKCLTILDPEYPEHLKNTYRVPLCLFYYGDISILTNQMLKLAVVGSRECSESAKNITEELVKGVCSDYVIVSGMAEGVDSIAHLAAIKNGGKTIAVLGTGIDYCYPSTNIYLYKELKEKHLVISEYPGSINYIQDGFPNRNRIISGLSHGVLITEAKMGSGTMITASFAINMGRDLMCVPDIPISQSYCNRLIKDGAYLVEVPEDVKNVMENKKILVKNLK